MIDIRYDDKEMYVSQPNYDGTVEILTRDVGFDDDYVKMKEITKEDFLRMMLDYEEEM